MPTIVVRPDTGGLLDSVKTIPPRFYYIGGGAVAGYLVGGMIGKKSSTKSLIWAAVGAFAGNVMGNHAENIASANPNIPDASKA